MLSLTENAQTILKKLISGSEEPLTGLRIAVESGGCAGLQYKMALVEAPISGDLTLDCGTAKVFVAPGSLDMLMGTTIDYVESLETSGFTFENPNAQHQCSCGKSFAA